MGFMLEEYGKKRHFEATPEPPAKEEPSPGQGPLSFVVHQHAARRLHYDLRLELDGVLKSWAIPHGPSLDPAVKRLAVMVEDHPLHYASFEGVIPAGEYGAGQVIVWDRGTYSPEDESAGLPDSRGRAEEMMRKTLETGKVKLSMHGSKMQGSWALVKMAHRGKDWLLIKHRDEFAEPARDLQKEGLSLLSGPDIEALQNRRPPAPAATIPANLSEVPGARPAPFPSLAPPMLAKLAASPFTDPAWIFEPKLDGYRTLAFCRQTGVNLLSRRELDTTGKFPRVAASLKTGNTKEMVLDGEIVALDELGRPCFQCLQQHFLPERQVVPMEAKKPVPIIYYVFDILYLNGYDLTGVALARRKEILEAALQPSGSVRLVDHFEGDGKVVYEAAVANGFEGIMAKRLESTYEAGRRSGNWLKVKAVMTDDFVIGGYSAGAGARTHTLGAILVGQYDENGRLAYSSHVGAGFSDEKLADLKISLDALRTADGPFAETPPSNAPVTWVRPELVAEVKFSERTRDGRLRAPVFVRLRDDKPAAGVRRAEVAPPAGREGDESPSYPPLRKWEETAAGLARQLQQPGDSLSIVVEGHKIDLSNLDKELWPAFESRRPLTKRDLLIYLAGVSTHLLPHLKDRPITLKRYPDGITGEYFYQKHWNHPLPGFIETVNLPSEKGRTGQPYLMCNNLASLIWLGQLADIELHTWFSRVSPEPDQAEAPGGILNYPDFIIFDLDPYIYSGKEAPGDEPELNRAAFGSTRRVAFWLKELLDSLSLASFIKTSGRTGLHVYVPITRTYGFHEVHAAAETIGRFLTQQHPKEITMDWAVERRAGMVFLDYNQNVYGKTLASVYSPRAAPEATVSTPLRWEELDTVYPTAFTLLTVPNRLARLGDLWSSILESRRDLKAIIGGQ